MPLPTNSGANSSSPKNSPSDAVLRESCSFKLSWVEKNCSGLSLHSSGGHPPGREWRVEGGVSVVGWRGVSECLRGVVEMC